MKKIKESNYIRPILDHIDLTITKDISNKFNDKKNKEKINDKKFLEATFMEKSSKLLDITKNNIILSSSVL